MIYSAYGFNFTVFALMAFALLLLSIFSIVWGIIKDNDDFSQIGYACIALMAICLAFELLLQAINLGWIK